MNAYVERAKKERIKRAKRLKKLHDAGAPYREIAKNEGISSARVFALIKSLA